MAKISQPFFETACLKCGTYDEAKFVFSTNGAVKQICNNCNEYQKFFRKSDFPTVYDIKLKIWYMVEGNLSVINLAKSEIEFIEGLTGLDAKIIYWKLYLHIRKAVLELTNQTT